MIKINKSFLNYIELVIILFYWVHIKIMPITIHSDYVADIETEQVGLQ